ncbi:MAG: DUF2842 domain-containing protein [Sphingomicrobium sp.]
MATFAEGRGNSYIDRTMTTPSFRKLAGIALIVLMIVVWAGFVASLARMVGNWPVIVQALYYLVTGIVWIVPLKPLIRWIETGSFTTDTGSN